MKKKIISNILIALLILLAFFSLVDTITAPPPMPHRFYGTAEDAAGDYMPAGTVVRAMIIDADDGSTQNFTTTVNSTGWYDFTDHIVSEGGHDGDNIFFYINDVNTTQSDTFAQGHETQLNLIDDMPISSVDTITPCWHTTSPLALTITAVDIGANGLKNVTLYYYYSTTNTTFTGPWMFDTNITPWLSISFSFTFPNTSGFYRFYSRATDNASNIENVPVANDTICGYDIITPTSSVNTISAYWKKTSPLTLTATASDATSGVRNVTFYYRFSADNSSWGGWVNNGTDTASPWSRVITFVNGTGYYEFYSIAKDNATNTESAPGSADARCGYDHTAPVTSMTALSTYKYQNFTVQWSATEVTSGIASWTIQSKENSSGTWTAWLTNISYTIRSAIWYIENTTINCTVYFRVLAVDNASNCGSWSSSINTTQDTPPKTPSSPSPSNGTTYSEGDRPSSLSWVGGDVNNDLVNYTIYLRAGNSTFNASYIHGYTENVTSHSITFAWSTTYYWKIVATDEHGASAAGPIWHFTTGAESSGPGPGPGPGPTTGNKAPTAKAGGPYIGYVNGTVTFNASKSTDTDGRIVGYRWDWTNDGTWDTDWLTSPTTTHVYTRTGNYVVKLQVKDNGSATDDDTANVTIKALPVIYASQRALDFLQITFGLQFATSFYATDTNNDGIVDTFTDPNHLLIFVRYANISGNASFLLSTGNDTIPEFFWDANANMTVLLTYVPVIAADTWIDPEAGEVLIVTNVEKSGWVYIEMTDPYPLDRYSNFTLTIKTTNNRIISPDMIWRENGSIYVLDDPSTQYIFTYSYTVLPPVFNPPNGTIFDASFTPPQGTTFNTARPTIMITYFEPVSILTITLNNQDIAGQITTTDHKTFTFTPTSDLAEGTYTISLTVEDADNNTLTSTATYTISLAKPSGEIPWLIIILIGIILMVVIVLIILRKRLLI